MCSFFGVVFQLRFACARVGYMSQIYLCEAMVEVASLSVLDVLANYLSHLLLRYSLLLRY